MPLQSDVVHVKGKPHLLGTIIWTYYEADKEARTEDLVLYHTSVPKDVLTAFVQTQRPPRGYVFVEFVKICHGSSLIHEDDLELVDRMFEIGFRVKKNLQSPFAGTVINASVKCSLQPIAYQPFDQQTGDHGSLKFSEKPSGCAVWPSIVDSSDDGPPELHDVPMAELTGYEPFCEDDYIIYREKVGKVKPVEREAVLLLPIQKVISIHDYNRIETPIFSAVRGLGLHIHEHAVKCDFGQLPEGSLSQEKTVRADTWFEPGDLVRFRDPADATQRYPVYRRISSDESFGYDLNLIRIMSTKTEVTVKWQDGSTTVEDATSLREFDEVDELWPGTVVALKESIEILHKPPPPKLLPFHLNESEAMVASYRLKKVGIVQTVDGGQRVASVKWYKTPDIELTHKGNMMTTSSSFGILGLDVTDVSIYELVAYSCLNPLIDDKVLIVPDTVHQATLPFYDENMNQASAGLCKMDFIMPSTFSETSFYLGLMQMSIAHTAWFRDSISIDTAPLPSQIDFGHTDFNGYANASFSELFRKDCFNRH
ncbi:hypothetical protein N8T08_009808 [Aspergillus melleus]|uniref:Uncharacterized protein n=1 Tax=Aspergillus melleus TaxID=138277 RepID=A0ACC3AT99_9EURO|nr:hypothetical protein N8T08_009808 [Aspergillus melleus]